VSGDPLGRVDVTGLTWRPYGRPQPILRDLDLRIEPGERVLLAGPSGSGKSTLLRGLAGLLLTADAGELSGSVRVDGEDPQARAGLVGLVLQDPGAGVVAASLGRDVAFGLENLGMPPEQMPEPVAAALRAVRLDPSRGFEPTAPTSALSGGELQRLALAGALAMAPRVLLLDEPTAMLDAESAGVVRAVVEEAARERRLTLVVVEHRLGPWLPLVDRLVVIGADGGIVADGAPADVVDEHGNSLAAQGIWVPGIPDPEPLDIVLAPKGRAVEHGAPVSEARGVSVRHTSRSMSGRERVVTAVRDADLTIEAGSAVALVGPSGSGKSSLLAALGGLTAPAAGRVELAGAPAGMPPHRLSSPELARRVAWVPQWSSAALVTRTVGEEVLVTARATGVDDELARERAEVLLERLGLAGLEARDPRLLSGGEQRRLAVAAAVVHGPALVLADEPTVGQDRRTWAAVMGVLEAARREGVGLVVTTHDDGVMARADEIVRMRAGRIVGRGRDGEVVVPTAAGGSDTTRPDAEPPTRRALAAYAGPLSLLLASLLVLPLPALLDSWRQSLVVLAVEVVLGAVALVAPGRGPVVPGRWRALAIRLGWAALAIAGVAWSTWLVGGRNTEVALSAAVRVLTLLVPSAVLMPFVDPDELGDHLAQRVRLPARPVVAFSAALQRFQAFGELWDQLVLARRVRGVGAGRSVVARMKEVGAVALGLLVGVFSQASTLALAMDARGFAGAYRRTWAGPATWRLADTLVVLGGLVPLAAALLAHSLFLE